VIFFFWFDNNNMKTAFLVALGLLVVCTCAYRVDKHLVTTDEYYTTARFCISVLEEKNKGKGGITVEQTAKKFHDGFAHWVLFTDDQYDSVLMNDSVSCLDKRLVNNGVQTVPVQKQNTWTKEPHDIQRPHIWYVMLLNCAEEKKDPETLDITYKIHLLDQDGSEVGYDERGLLALNIVYLIFFSLLGAFHGVAVYFLFRKGVAHPIVYILAGVIGFIILSLFFVTIHWGVYGNNGYGANGCRVFGQLLMGIANIVFAVLLIAIASGWAITYHDLPRRVVILTITGVYFFVYLILFIIINCTGQTAASTQFVYAKGALLAFVIIYILVCWIGVWSYFAYCLYTTYREEAQFDKRLFYLIFGIGATVWFLLPALFNFISMGIAEWFRPRVVDAFQLTVTFIGVTALVVLLWPSRVEKYFRISSRNDFSTSDVPPVAPESAVPPQETVTV